MKYFIIVGLILTLFSCTAKEFAVNENGRVYPCAPIGTEYTDSSMRVGYVVKITIIGKRGQYAYALIDKQGDTIKKGQYEKTHIVRGKGEKENLNGPPIKYRARYYEPDTLN